MASIQFLGAAGTVSGSKYVLQVNGKTLLIDAGLYQGKKELRQRNWQQLPIDPKRIDYVLLTHAHIDHSGYLPVLIRDGFRGPVITTYATNDLCSLLLPDAGRLQEEEAHTANSLRYSKHNPARPLFTESDAHNSLSLFQCIAYEKAHTLADGISVVFRPAGHILGSSSIEITIQESGTNQHRIVFSGDLGRFDAPVVPNPVPISETNWLLVECTYGNRTHGQENPKDTLASVISETYTRGGATIIPSFAVGRTQELLYYLRELEEEDRIPVQNVFVDSPMAVDATPFYEKRIEEHDESMSALLNAGKRPFCTKSVHFARSVTESKKINSIRRCIIISASGMATGGRVLHHLKNRLRDNRNTVLFVGHQSEGTRGRLMQDGASTVKIHGEMVSVEARIETVQGFSAHADHQEVGRWLDGLRFPPECVFCVHGENAGLQAMKGHIESRGSDWKAHIPRYMEKIELA